MLTNKSFLLIMLTKKSKRMMMLNLGAAAQVEQRNG
jgi:hypothetical protein